MIIRRARERDLLWLCAQLPALEALYGAQHSLMRPTEAVQRLQEWLQAPDMYPCWIAERLDGTRVGFIAGVMHPHFFNPLLTCLTELLWWVIPDARGSRAAHGLLNAFTRYGREHADWVTMVLGTITPVKPRALERLGFVYREANFLLEVV